MSKTTGVLSETGIAYLYRAPSLPTISLCGIRVAHLLNFMYLCSVCYDQCWSCFLISSLLFTNVYTLNDIYPKLYIFNLSSRCRGRGHMVVGFTTAYVISAYHH